MGERSVVRGEKRWTVAADPAGGEVTMSLTPGPFPMDVDTAEEAYRLFGAAIRTARGELQ